MVGPGDDEELLDDEEVKTETPGLGDDEGGSGDTGQESESAAPEEGLTARRERDRDLREQLRKQAEHTARVERELNDLRSQSQQRQQQQPQGESDEAFEARMQLLPTDSQMRERFTRSERRHQHELLLTRMQAADASDRAEYLHAAASDPRYTKYADEVERVLSEERRMGRDWKRSAVLSFLIGQKVLANKSKVEAAKAAGQSNIKRQQAKQGGSASDVARPQQTRRYAAGDMSPEAVRARLEGVLI